MSPTAADLPTIDAPIIDAARWLVHERGFSVIALDHPATTRHTDPKKIGKVPIAAWLAFQETRPTDDNLIEWFGNGTPRNLGIVTGVISNIIVIDGDNVGALDWMRGHLPPTEMRTRTAKGEHWFYRHPGSAIRNTTRLQTGDGRLSLDVRADGGYVVAPGSLHASGVPYARVGTWPPVDQLPIFDSAWLEPVQPAIPVHHQHEADRIRRRARKYLDKTPPAIEGQGGDAHTYQVCCRLVRGFDLSDADALDLLSAWNQRCLPPWTEADLFAKIQHARLYGDEPVGGRLGPRGTATDISTISTGAIGSTTGAAFNLTDSGNAEYFAKAYGRDVRFDHRRNRWLLWQRHRWQPDADAAIFRLAKAAMCQRFKDAARLDDPDARSREAKWAIASESRARIEALLYLARAEALIADAGDGWDADPMLFGAPNGVIDLRSGTLRPGCREDRITMAGSVAFDSDAACPRWERFIAEVFIDLALVSFIQRAVGYSLTGETGEQCLFLCYGQGSNGKGRNSALTLRGRSRWY